MTRFFLLAGVLFLLFFASACATKPTLQESKTQVLLKKSTKPQFPEQIDDRYGAGALGPRVLFYEYEETHVLPERIKANVHIEQHRIAGIKEPKTVRVWELPRSPLRPAKVDPNAYLESIGIKSVYDLSSQARLLYIPRMFGPSLRKGNLQKVPDGQWRSIVQEAATLFGLEETFIYAVIQAESGFNAQAVSKAGAQGAMQIMPATGQALVLKDPFDLRANIFAGCAYLAAMFRRYRNLQLTLAAYNAGPGAVDMYGGIPPYAETQTYVRKVLNLWQGEEEGAEGYLGRKVEQLELEQQGLRMQRGRKKSQERVTEI